MTAPLSPAELDDLRALAGAMIPASQAHGVPGADDAEIFAEIARGAGASADALRRQRGRVLRLGLRGCRTQALGLQLWRGVTHTLGLALWFTALPFVPLSDIAAIGFTTPLFIMLGAALFLGEKTDARRWAGVGLGFLGVMVVMAPAFTGSGGFAMLLLLASAPLFAASFLIAKALTRHDSPAVIVIWQAAMVAVMSLPIAIPGWTWPSAWEWTLLVACGVIGSLGHFCLTRAFAAADISAAQPFKFVELIWASLWGFLIFYDVPGVWTFVGAAIIFGATTWVARAEQRRKSG